MRVRCEVGRGLAARLAICVLAVGASARADTVSEVQRAAEAGEFSRALQLARAEVDPLISLRAQVWLHYRARDFDAAFAVAEQGLAVAPDDLWLAERATAAALWLGEPVRAERALARFSSGMHSAPAAAAEPFRGLLEAARTQCAELSSAATRARRALTRARWMSFSILSLVLVSLIVLGQALPRRGAE